MKISQALAEIKQIESELLRKINTRDRIIKRELVLKSWEKEKKSSRELEKLEKGFIENKKKRFLDITREIGELRKALIDQKSKINKKNIELGLDKKILGVKWARIELSGLMEFLKKDKYDFITDKTDELEEIGVLNVIKELEKEKNRLDSDIQNSNFRNSL